MGNLALPTIAANQQQKEVTSNDADEKLDLALTNRLTVDLAAGDLTLSSAQFRENWAFLCVSAAAPRTLTVPQLARPFLVLNDSGERVTVARGTAAVEIAEEARKLLYTDGTANGLHVMAYGGATPYLLQLYVEGQPTDGGTVLVHIATDRFRLPLDLAGSRAHAAVAATASAVFTIKKGAAAIGTMTCGAGSNTPTFTFSAEVIVDVGEVLSVTASSPQDATLADIAATFRGERL